MSEESDPRPGFAERLRALKDAADVSVRDLEIASARTPRRRGGQAPLRLKRSTIAGMISRTRPVRPEQEHFEAFVDTCLRIAEESGRSLPADLGDRQAWDAAYRDLLLRMAGARSINRSAAEAAGRLRSMRPASGDFADEAGTSDGDSGGICPYRGLEAFGPEDAPFYFGRVRLIGDLLDRVAEKVTSSGPLMVTGPSGSGKSSLLRAGLTSALTTENQPSDNAGTRARVLYLTPGADPVTELAKHLAALTVEASAGGLAPQALADPAHLRAALRQASGRAGSAHAVRLFVIVDQFEELFTLCPDEQQRRLFLQALDALCAAPAEDAPAVVVLGMRADFYGHCAAHPQLLKSLEHPLIVGPMGSDDLREAIEGPARLAGLTLQDGLVDLLLEDLGPGGADRSARAGGVLPLLSHALLSTWQHREGQTLTLSGYRATGGIARSLAQTADATLESLDLAGRRIARRMLPRLIRLGEGTEDTRRHVLLADLFPPPASPDHGIARKVLDRFVRARLVSVDEDRAEITHEALTHAWPQLRAWIQTDRATLLVRQQLDDDAREWLRHGRDPAFLYRGTRLAGLTEASSRWEYASTFGAELTEVTRAFLRASGRAATRGAHVRRAAVAALVVLLVASLTSGILAIDQAREATDREHVTRSRELAQRAEIFTDTDPAVSRLLAATAWSIAPTPEARRALITTTLAPARAVFTGHTGRVNAVAISPKGGIVAGGGDDGTVRLWDMATGRAVGRPMTSPEELVNDLAFTRDGSLLVVASEVMTEDFSSGGVRLWDVATQRLSGEPLVFDTDFDAGTEVFSALDISPDGTRLAAEADGEVHVWDLATREQLATFPTPSVEDLAFSPDGGSLAIADTDGAIRLWNVADGSNLSPLMVSSSGNVAAWRIAFTPDGTTLISVDSDETIRFWDLATSKQVGEPITRAGLSLALTPDGTTLVTVGEGNVIVLYDTRARRQVSVPFIGHIGPALDLAVSADGRILASAGEEGTVRIWDLATGRQVGRPLTQKGGETIHAMYLAPDGRTVATSSVTGGRLWDVTARRRFGDLIAKAELGYSGPVVFGPDGKTLAIGETDGTIQLWDVPTQRRNGLPLLGHTENPEFSTALVFALDFSFDGGLLASSGIDGTLRFWDVRRHRQIGAALADAAGVSVAFSPDGRLLAVGMADGTVWLWDTASHQRIAVLHGHRANVADLAFNAEGTLLATAGADRTIRLWDMETRRQVGQPLVGHAGIVRSLAFAPEGDLIAGAGQDATIRLWDVATQQQIGRPLIGHDQDVVGVAFTPDGQALVSAGYDGTIRQWDIARPPDLLKAVCGLAQRPITAAEWELYVPGEAYIPVCR
ncbi:AAA family ATPase [Streptosporangium sp. NPDC049644]|uniref:nSTAND1 domain-containing NTPase n=1 Tax=Streptosporangium sp. NPDC049644 TaxID=3155507 RepID=UPI003448904E